MLRPPLSLILCTSLALAAGSPAARAFDKVPVDESIGDVAEPASNGTLSVEGVGLVIGLQGTGSDPGPSWLRDQLKTDLMRNPEISSSMAEAILASPNTSLVIVSGKIPTGISTADRWDVDVSLPAGSTTTSLAGGFLMLTELSEIGIASKGPMEGKPIAKALGPVLAGSAAEPTDPKRGRVLGGGRSRVAIPYILLIKEKHQSGRTAKLLEDRVNFRFHQREPGGQAGMATAKRDTYLELRVPQRYHQNQLRYLQLIKAIRLSDTPELAQQRIDAWSKELMDPLKAGATAIRLEALGKNSIPILTSALGSPDFQVRFFAAEALAYLDDAAGSDVLAEAVRLRPEFRLHALAALAATTEPAAGVRLRELMDEADPQVRYGAFDALRTADPSDPALGRTRVVVAEKPEEDPYALQTGADAPIRRRTEPVQDPFDLYVVDSQGPPMVHVTRSRRCEIVLFGVDQKLMPPAVLGGTGPILINASSTDARIEVTRLESSKAGLIEQSMSSSPDLVSVIRTVARLGATYPQIVAILEAAQKQKNLGGPLLADAMPADSSGYDEAQIFGADIAKKDPDLRTAGAEEIEGEGEGGRKRPRLLGRLRERFKRESPRPEDGGSEDGPDESEVPRPDLP